MQEKAIRSSLVDQVQTFIIKRIQNREYEPGSRLNIEELAKEFGVSRTPVREAINRLVQNGIVEQRYNAGPCVAVFSTGQEIDIVKANMYLFRGVFTMLQEEHDHSGLTEELKNVLREQEDALAADDKVAFHETAVRFHEVIIGYCPNVTLRNFTLQSQHQITISTLHYQAELKYRERSLQDHKGIYEAIASNDLPKAAALMDEHNAFSLNFISKAAAKQMKQ